jgi:hypothetical protein
LSLKLPYYKWRHIYHTGIHSKIVIAPDGLSVPVISQDDDDDFAAEPLEDDAIEVIYDWTERL